MKSHVTFEWSPLLVGALICCLLQIGASLLGGGIGLSAIEIEKGDTPGTALTLGAITALAFSLFGSFFAGSYLSYFWSGQSSRDSVVPYGLTTWAIASALLLLFVGRGVVSSMGKLLANAGVVAGATSGTEAMLERIERIRIVSDLSIIKGKIVTQLHVPDTKGGIVGASLKEGKKTVQEIEESPETKAELEKAGEEIRRATALASFAALALMVLSAIASVLGAGVADSAKRR